MINENKIINLHISLTFHNKGDTTMKETIENLKEIFADKRERREFIGSMLCLLGYLAFTYIVIRIFSN